MHSLNFITTHSNLVLLEYFLFSSFDNLIFINFCFGLNFLNHINWNTFIPCLNKSLRSSFIYMIRDFQFNLLIFNILILLSLLTLLIIKNLKYKLPIFFSLLVLPNYPTASLLLRQRPNTSDLPGCLWGRLWYSLLCWSPRKRRLGGVGCSTVVGWSEKQRRETGCFLFRCTCN